ncbi:hypothetical protein JM79_2494 [Gramella sp. Hel_I_59]|nr:hypothetical protein JM79_2494 [Gramella sp. Hel_I_59]
MNFIKPIYLLSSLIIISIFVIPFIYISNYVILVLDDLCRAPVTSQNIIQLIQDWYLTHNGRFINSILSLLPVYNLDIYRIIVALSFPFLGFVLYDFLQKLFKIYELRLDITERIFLSSLLFVVLIAEIPSLFEFFYWYAAETVYLFSFIAFLYFLLLLFRIYMELSWNLFVGLFLIIFLNGNNELFLGFNNIILLSLLVRWFLKRKGINFKILLLNIISWITSLIFLLSPGTLSRRGELGYEGDIFVSIKVGLLYGGRFILENLIEIPNLLFFPIVFLLISKNRIKFNKVKTFHPVLLLFISYLSITSFYGLKFYATGLVERDVGRVGNILHLVVLIFVLLNMVNLAVVLGRKWKIHDFYKKYLPPILVILLIIFIFFKNQNYVDLRQDLIQNNFHEFEKAVEQRNNTIVKTKGDTLVLKQIQGTLLLKSGDEMLISKEWPRTCFLRYVNKKYGKSFQVLQVKKSDNTNHLN